MRLGLTAIFALFSAISGCDCNDPLHNAPPAPDAREARPEDAGFVLEADAAGDAGVELDAGAFDAGAADSGTPPGLRGSLIAIQQGATSDLIEIDPNTGAVTPLVTLRNPNAGLLLCGTAINGSRVEQVFAHSQDRERSILVTADLRTRQIVAEVEVTPRPGQLFRAPDAMLRTFTSALGGGIEYRNVAADGSTSLITTLTMIGGVPICGPISINNGDQFLIYSTPDRGDPSGERLLTIDSNSGAILRDVASESLHFLRKDDQGRIVGLKLDGSQLEVRRLDPMTGVQQPIFSLPLGFGIANDTVALDPSGERMWLVGLAGPRGSGSVAIYTLDLVTGGLSSAPLADTPAVLRFVR